MTHEESRKRNEAIIAEVSDHNRLFPCDINEMAERYGVGYPYILKLCKDAGVKLPRKIRTDYQKPSKKYDNVDWTKQDVVIAEELCVSRERIRQIRKKKNLPKCTYKRQWAIHDPLKSWITANKETLQTLTLRESIALYGKPANEQSFYSLCRGLGVTFQRQPKKELTRENLHQIYEIADTGYKTPCWNCTVKASRSQKHLPVIGGEYAHRFVFRLFGNEMPEDKPWLTRLCRNPRCINPEHLLPVTVKEAHKSRVYSNGRGNCGGPTGTKLSKEKVEEIQREFAEGKSIYAIAKRMGYNWYVVHCALGKPDMSGAKTGWKKGRKRKP